MFHAYRYRLEKCSGRKERGKYTIQILHWHQKPHNLLKTCMLSNYWITISDNKSINNSVASLFQTQIWRFFDAIFPRKSTKYLAPRRLMFHPRAFGFVISHERKDSGDENTSGVRHADLYLGGPGLPLEVVSARLNFSARGPKTLLLHGKNQAGRALNYRSACQNLGVAYPKWMSCKCALIIIIKRGPRAANQKHSRPKSPCAQYWPRNRRLWGRKWVFWAQNILYFSREDGVEESPSMRLE